MVCSSPLHAYYNDYIFTKYGNKQLFFITEEEYNNFIESDVNHKLLVPCGHCIECRINRAQDWSTRAMLESKYYLSNWFVTLTYEDNCLPLIKTISRKTGQTMVLGQLVYDHFQTFMKDHHTHH